jgi:hypothetical protein
MSKFRYYITDLFDGCIKGTNDETKAAELAMCEDYFVVDTQIGIWLDQSGGIEIRDIDDEK